MELDSVSFEVMSRKLAAITDEMYFSVQRAARSSYVKEAADFAVALLDPAGDVFAYPPSATFSFLIDTDFRHSIDAVPGLEPGDVIITNDPYASHGLSTHLPDLHLLQPYFHAGEIVAYGWSFVHCADIGGSVPGSVSPALTSIFHEGLRIPPMKLVKRGEQNTEFLNLLRLNTRMPDVVVGDIRAMLGALETGNRRLGELIARQGIGRLQSAQRDLQDYTARKARDVLRRIPDGAYEFWDFLDDDMITGIPIRVRLRLVVQDGMVEMDLTGSDPQVRSAYNVPSMGRRMYWLTFRLTTILTTFDPLMPHNAGLYRSISVRNQPGSVLNAEFPDAVCVRNSVPYRLFDCVTGAILKSGSDLQPGISGGSMITVSLAEIGADGVSRRVEVIQPMRCGMGGSQGMDGVDTRDNSLNNMRNQPVEQVEAQSSIRIVDYDIHPDSGGPGQWRGGVGQAITVEVLCDNGILLARGLDRLRFPPWGVRGGQPGARLSVIRNAGRPDERALGKIHELHVRRGETLTIRMPGGGGFGDPFLRDPALVLGDVRQGFVSAGSAERDYGVVITADAVDQDATQALRASRGSRPPATEFAFGPERTAWEAVFTDAVMHDINTQLYAMPKPRRQDARQALFETAVPGVTNPANTSLAALIPDAAAASRRVQDMLSEMRGA